MSDDIYRAEVWYSAKHDEILLYLYAINRDHVVCYGVGLYALAPAGYLRREGFVKIGVL